jgi:hypothetical protein
VADLAGEAGAAPDQGARLDDAGPDADGAGQVEQ